MNNSTKCSANVTTNRNRVKVYTEHANYGDYLDVVYLKDGQKFEIELHNPYPFKVLAKIKMNGNYISRAGIVLNPGQRIYLERFIDKDESFVFSTYEVDNTEVNRQAIADNGNLDVEFYSQVIIGSTSDTYYHPNTTTCIYPGSVSGGTTPYYYTNTGVINTTLAGSVSLTTSNANVNYLSTSLNVAGSLETGRVEKGNASGQKLYESNDNFGSTPFEKTGVKLLPLSRKPIVAINKEVRSYCTECGTRVKKASWKYCPSCGCKI